MQLPVSSSSFNACRSPLCRPAGSLHARLHPTTPARARAAVHSSSPEAAFDLPATDRYERILRFVEDNSLAAEAGHGPAVQRQQNFYDEEAEQELTTSPSPLAMDQQSGFFNCSSSSTQQHAAAGQPRLFLNSYDEEAQEEYPAVSTSGRPPLAADLASKFHAVSSSTEPLTAVSVSHHAHRAASRSPRAAAAAARRRQKRFARMTRAELVAKQRAAGLQQPLAAFGDLELMEAWIAPAEGVRDMGEYALSAAAVANTHLARQRCLFTSYCEEAMGSFDEGALA